MSENLNFKKISVHEGPKQSPGFLLWHISTSWRSRIETVLKTFGLTHPQFVVLATIGWLTKTGDSVTQIAIGKMAGLDPNTTSQILKGLEIKELIKRTQSVDGRAKNASLTKKGLTTLNQSLPSVEEADAQFFHALPKGKMTTLINRS